jgi:hypothetical protein
LAKGAAWRLPARVTTDTTLGREVAVKVLQDKFAPDSEGAML